MVELQFLFLNLHIGINFSKVIPVVLHQETGEEVMHDYGGKKKKKSEVKMIDDS